MKQAATAVLALLAVLCAGCTAQSRSAGPASTGPASTGPASTGPASTEPTAQPAGVGLTSHSLPGCTTTSQHGPALAAAGATLTHVPGRPFGVAANGGWAFVALGSTVGVFRGGSSPALVRQIPVSSAALGEALTPDGRYLLVADAQAGVDVLSVHSAENGRGTAVVGVLSAPGALSPAGAIEVAISPDGRYAFVSLEDDMQVAVFDLGRALADGFGPADYVGSIPTRVAPVGLAVSPDGRWLYSTSEGQTATNPVGTLAVISVREAESDPAGSVVATVPAGCNPVCVITSADGSVVWVTARASDALLAFSAARLQSRAPDALLADVRVGVLPVGLALVRSGSTVVVADSDRFNVSGAAASLAVVDVADALAGRPALLGYLPAGGFPRDMALEPSGGTLLVANFASGQVEAVRVAALP